jgi:Glycogen recognition site of AMP-activated protein kinase
MDDRSRMHWRSRAQAATAGDAEQAMIAAKVAAPLRAPERADPTFADRVMTAVRAAGRETRAESPTSWWRRSLVLRVTPLSGLALAAGLAAIALAGAELLSARNRAPDVAHHVASTPDTVHVVRFVFVAPGASSVALVGDFNQWDVNAHRLVPAGADGIWSATASLTPGRHEYAFVIDGTRWVADPAAPAVADEFGGESSIVTVNGLARPRSS